MKKKDKTPKMKKFPGKTPGLYQPNLPTYNIEWIRRFLKEKYDNIQSRQFKG